MPCSGCAQQTEHCCKTKMSGLLAPCRDKQPHNDSFANPAIALHESNWFGNRGGDISKGKGGLERDLWLKGSQGAAQERMLKSKTLANLL